VAAFPSSTSVSAASASNRFCGTEFEKSPVFTGLFYCTVLGLRFQPMKKAGCAGNATGRI
jgi:hypothetical protein